jgi:hypothetical protein
MNDVFFSWQVVVSVLITGLFFVGAFGEKGIKIWISLGEIEIWI